MAEKDGKYSIRLRGAGLSEVNGEIIAQGFLDLEAINQLKVDDYQREVLRASGIRAARRSKIEMAVAAGARLPAIVIGMRGQSYRSSGGDLILQDPCYIVDGLQRAFAIKSHAEAKPEDAKHLLIGCEVRFETSKEIEKDLFQTLNTKRTPMSPNVILRNARDTNKAILTLYGLSVSDHTSVLFDRVQWTQRMNQGQLFTGLALVKVMDALHRHVSRAYAKRGVLAHSVISTSGSGAGWVAQGLDRRANTIGLKTFRENTEEFFGVLDECFGIRKIEVGAARTYLRQNFMMTLARLFSDHSDFWNGDRLTVSTAHKKRIASFPIDDPEVVRLAGAGNMAAPILYSILLNHMNKGMKKNHLQSRKALVVGGGDESDEEAA